MIAPLFAEADHLAEGLIGAGLLLLGTLASVPIALYHALSSLGEPSRGHASLLRGAWIACAVPIWLGLLLMGGQADKLLVPYLPFAFLLPLANVAAAWNARARLEAGPLRAGDRWALRLAPLVWLGLFGWVALAVFPKT